MPLEKLRYFKLTAEELNMTRAAEKLRITQPALSNAISKLEREYHATFFERKKPRLVLTPEGQHFYNFVNTVLAREERVAGELKDIRLHYTGQLRLGTTLTRSITFLPEVLTLFASAHPRIRLSLYVRSHRFELERKLADNELDLIVSPLDAALPSAFRTVPLERSYFCLTLPRSAIESILPSGQTIAEFAASPLSEQRELIFASGLMRRLPCVYCGPMAARLAPRFMARHAPDNPAILNMGDFENLLSVPYCRYAATFTFDSLAVINQSCENGVPNYFIYYIYAPDSPFSSSVSYSTESRNPALPLLVHALVDFAKQRRTAHPKEFFEYLGNI